ncbi:MAG: hypothetical protein AB1898_17650 [Acidobacteriota bacterium]
MNTMQPHHVSLGVLRLLFAQLSTTAGRVEVIAKKDKALVKCAFITGSDRFIYTVTLHRVADNWKLQGVRETMQELLPAPPVGNTKSDDKK